MNKHPAVDVHKAVTVGSTSASGGSGGDSTEFAGLSAAEDARVAANEMLLSLPGVNASNVRAVQSGADSIFHLSQMTVQQLSGLLGNQTNAKKLHSFFRQRVLTN